MEHGDGETAAFTSPEDIKTQMKVAITNFQASLPKKSRFLNIHRNRLLLG